MRRLGSSLDKVRLIAHIQRYAMSSAGGGEGISGVNKSELQKFASIGKEWWDPQSKLGTGPLHAMNPVRVQFIKDQLLQQQTTTNRQRQPSSLPLSGMSILDVGCGGGLLSESLCRLGARVTAIDPAEENIQIATWHANLNPKIRDNIDYRCCTVEAIAESDQMRFDAVCSLEVIEHVDHPQDFLHDCLRCLKPNDKGNVNGSLFISTINRSTLSYWTAIIGAEYLLRLLPPDTHDWHKFVTPEELAVMAGRFSSESSNKSSNNSNSTAGVGAKLVRSQGLVFTPQLPTTLSDLWTNPPLTWSLSDSQMAINYISHIVRMD